MTSLVACDGVPRSSRILSVLLVGYVALLPYQFEMGNGMNFAPADCLMLLVLLLGAGQLKYRKAAWSVWHFSIAAVFAIGSLVAALRFGVIDGYELFNKIPAVLPFLSYPPSRPQSLNGRTCGGLAVFVLKRGAGKYCGCRSVPVVVFFGVANHFTRYEGMRCREC
jgi:hypothetical protein